MKNGLMKNELVKLLRSGIFPNEKNRIWTMCQVTLQLLGLTVKEAEKSNMTNEQFFIEFQDLINAYSIKDPNVENFKCNLEKFNADSGVNS